MIFCLIYYVAPTLVNRISFVAMMVVDPVVPTKLVNIHLCPHCPETPNLVRRPMHKYPGLGIA